MPKTIIKVKTWVCTQCSYRQDFEPTQELMDLHFNKSRNFRIHDIQVNECPSCALKGNRGVQMEKETDLAKKSIMTIMGEEDIEPEIEQSQKGERQDIDVSTEEKKNVYRTKRRKDIVDAIAEARKYEDK